VEYRQERISQSQFHEELEAALVEGGDSGIKTNNINVVRYWSDYSLVEYHPRSIHRLPDAPEWEDPCGDWSNSGETFNRYDEVFLDNFTSQA
jgi:hypothetical protein